MNKNIHNRAIAVLENYSGSRDLTTKLGMFVDIGEASAVSDTIYRNVSSDRAGMLEEFVWNSCQACTQGFWKGGVSNAMNKMHAIVSISMQGDELMSDAYGEELSTEEILQFYDLLLNHSPWKMCIQPSTPEFAMEKGIIIDCNYSRNLVTGAMMAHRLAWENTKIVKSALALVNLGVSKDIALMLGHTFDKHGAYSSKSWHVALDGSRVSLKTLGAFLRCEHVVEPTMMESCYYNTTIHESWGYADSTTLVEAISDSVDRGNKVIDNPFAKTLTIKVPDSRLEDVANYFKSSAVLAEIGIDNE